MLKPFDLQLFNTEGGEAAGTTVADPGKAGGAAAESGAEKVVLVDGAVRLVRGDEYVSDIDDADDNHEEGDGETDPDAGVKGTPAEEQALYTPEELRTTEFERLDPKRLPLEMQAWYRAMQAPITRKNMELAESLKAVREFVEQARQQPAQPQISEAEFYQRLDNALLHEVAKRFNVEAGKLVGAGYDQLSQPMKLAYNRIQSEWEREAAGIQEQMKNEQRREVAFKSTAATLETELQALDPVAFINFEAKIKGEEMPLKQIKAIREAILSGDKKTVVDIFEEHRKAFHAGKNNIQTGEKKAPVSPAKLEGAGYGDQPEGKSKIDYSELGKLTNFDEKLVWLRRHNIKP